jgi:CBS domain-containing protein
MATTIGEICNREVIITTPEMTVAGAAKLMRQHHVGSIVVVDNARTQIRIPIGLLTDRDIVIELTAMDLDPDGSASARANTSEDEVGTIPGGAGQV